MTAQATNAAAARIHLERQAQTGTKQGDVQVLFNPTADHFSFAVAMREPFEPFAGNRLATLEDLL